MRTGGLRSTIVVGHRVDPALSRRFVAITVASHVSQTLRALWIKVIVDAIVTAAVGSAIVWGVVLAVNDVARMAAAIQREMLRRDLYDEATRYFEAESMEVTGRRPGIDHFECPGDRDRQAELRHALPVLAEGVDLASQAAAVALRLGIVVVLLVLVHPALVVLPLAALPSIVAARSAQRTRLDGQRAMAAPDRRAGHLLAMATEPETGKEALCFGLHSELRERAGASWWSASQCLVRSTARAALVQIW
jgi:ATP-binding cassette subfamily B protein